MNIPANDPRPRARIHPLIAIAAISLIALSLTGIAAITGLIGQPGASPAGTAVVDAQRPEPSAPPSVAEAPLPPTAHARAATAPPAAYPAPDGGTHAPARAPAQVVAQAPRPASPPTAAGSAPMAQQHAPARWGTVESIREIRQEAAPTGVGAIAGGVVGGLLGNQVGGGNGRILGTVAGAIGGGYAGNEIEKRTRATSRWEIAVRMDDGTHRRIVRDSPAGYAVGERIQL